MQKFFRVEKKEPWQNWLSIYPSPQRRCQERPSIKHDPKYVLANQTQSIENGGAPGTASSSPYQLPPQQQIQQVRQILGEIAARSASYKKRRFLQQASQILMPDLNQLNAEKVIYLTAANGFEKFSPH